MLWFSAIMGTSIYHLGFAWRNPTTPKAGVGDMLTFTYIAPKKAKGEKMDLGTFLQDPSMRPAITGFH